MIVPFAQIPPMLLRAFPAEVALTCAAVRRATLLHLRVVIRT